MKKILTTGGALLLTTTLAHAGGLDRSGQPIGAIFENGDYVEFSYGYVMPEIDGTFMGTESGNVAEDYTQVGAAFKSDFGNGLSAAFIIDQPYGAAVSYEEGTGYPVAGANAKVNSYGLTGLVRYEFTPNFSAHGGLRAVRVDGNYNPAATYDAVYDEDLGTGYVAGVAYEREEIALRVALTYSSEIEFELDGEADAVVPIPVAPGFAAITTDTTLETTMPESINLDFQSGVAADTLVFGSVRWTAWDGVELVDTWVRDVAGGDPLVSYDNDVYTYTLGIGRRLTEQLSASFSVGYEAATDEPASNLAPTDGYISYAVGASYDIGNGAEVSGGIRYVNVGDATTEGFGGEFEDNSVVAVGMKLAYNF